MHDAYGYFSHLRNLQKAKSARRVALSDSCSAISGLRGEDHGAEFAEIAQKFRSDISKIDADIASASEACVEILLHSGRDVTIDREALVLYQIIGATPPKIDIRDLSGYIDIHDLHVPDHLEPADAA